MSTKKKVSQLRMHHFAFIEAFKMRGGKICFVHCGKCKKTYETPRPRKVDVGDKGYWDSMQTCVHCGALNFVQIFPTGRTIARETPGTIDDIVEVPIANLCAHPRAGGN